ncbi:hypothetical protein AHAS_Ahas13G0242200 [Arachis hypogaea]
MKKQGCEVEAIGINYKICTGTTEQTFKIFRKPPQLNNEEHGEDVNCVAKPSEVLAVVGPSGAEKSFLLEILAGKVCLE